MFVDSNIFILAALGQDKKAKACRTFLSKVEKGEQHAVTSLLVLDEVLKVLETHTKSRDKAAAKTSRFSLLPNLRVCDVTSKHFSESLKHFKLGLEPRDALHVAAALDNSSGKILSYDKDFDSVSGIKRFEP